MYVTPGLTETNSLNYYAYPYERMPQFYEHKLNELNLLNSNPHQSNPRRTPYSAPYLFSKRDSQLSDSIPVDASVVVDAGADPRAIVYDVEFRQPEPLAEITLPEGVSISGASDRTP